MLWNPGTYNYDRNRLLTATSGATTASYNYDPYGRLDTITAGGTVLERNTYDGFDHLTENRKTNAGTTTTTKYTYDPLERTTSKTTDAGTSKEKTTTFNYLGLSGEVHTEEIAGRTTASYQYGPSGERLSQIKYNPDGTTEDGYYGYNPHSDVEQLTDKTGTTKATYGYTAYGGNDDPQFTGIDKPDPADPTKQPYNPYRFNAKRWDQTSGNYDMGFRDYSPGLNRFLTRDTYNGALADMNLGLDPFTGNRYAFGGGNPIGSIEIDVAIPPNRRDFSHADVAYLMFLLARSRQVLAGAARSRCQGWPEATRDGPGLDAGEDGAMLLAPGAGAADAAHAAFVSSSACDASS